MRESRAREMLRKWEGDKVDYREPLDTVWEAVTF